MNLKLNYNVETHAPAVTITERRIEWADVRRRLRAAKADLAQTAADEPTTGIIELTAEDFSTKWNLQNEEGYILKTGVFYPALNLEDEDFDFDGVTDRVATASGHRLENDMRYTDSGTGRLYWTVIFN